MKQSTQAKRLGFGKASGFVNAVLRRALREPSPPLPDERDAQEYARAVLSHPAPLFRRMTKLLGTEAARGARQAAQRRSAADRPRRAAGDRGRHDHPHEKPGFFVVSGATEAVLAEVVRGRGAGAAPDERGRN